MSAINPITSLSFIDTNIWLYAFSDSQDKIKTRRARKLIRQTPQIALSTQVVNEVSLNLLRKFNADEPDICKLIRSLYRKYIVVEFNPAILLQASDLRTTHSLS